MPYWLLIKPFLSLKNIGYFILACLITYGTYKAYRIWEGQYDAGHLAGLTEGKAGVQKLWDAQKLIDKAAYDKSVKIAKAKDDEWNKQLQDAKDEATKQKQIASIAATVAHNSAVGLLSTTNTAEAKLPNATKETSDEYTRVLGDSFRDCVTQYTEMGRRFDEYKIGYDQLNNSWPQ